MAEVLSGLRQSALDRQTTKPVPLLVSRPFLTEPQLQPATKVRSGHLNLDIFSPVNQNGSFEFDRVLKSGEVYKRTRKTKQWKKFFLVLRPNLLSIYKNSSEEKLHKQISLSDLTAVAYLKDPKDRRGHIFGLFSPSRNYQLQAKDENELHSWVSLIKREARIEEAEQELYLGSPVAHEGSYQGINQPNQKQRQAVLLDRDRMGSSSPELIDLPARPSITQGGISIPGIRRESVHNLDYSGADLSDFSDAPPNRDGTALKSSMSHPGRQSLSASSSGPETIMRESSVIPNNQGLDRNTSQISIHNLEQDEERVIWHGFLLCLKSKGGVRQWKKLWVVLRPKHLAFYKNMEEYATRLLIPLSNIINAVEIDPVSRSKSHCLQIIAEEKNYRFCAMNEEALARCLGALKSQLARKRGAVQGKAAIP